ncbi:MAG: DUF1501 domain-containing protein [Gammaproteobacteria bacterium]|nr:DUF1501 domain-containing protein [Gammaproteobacteria bacterium]
MSNKHSTGEQQINSLARRAFLKRGSLGIGALALADMLGMRSASAMQDLGVLSAGHHAPRAKRIIYLHMYGAISHVDTFDYCPQLEKMHGQQIPASVMGEGRVSTMVLGQTAFPLVRNLAPFKQRGQSGAWVSDLWPHVADIADELCFIRSMHTDHVNHNPAAQFMQTGFQLVGRPSFGAWINYGLGSDNNNLPAFIVMNNMGPGQGQNVDSAIFGSGFLPSHFQGVQFMKGNDPVHYIHTPEGLAMNEQAEDIAAINALAREQYAASGDDEILSKISQYEMAYRMQSSVPDATNVADEPDHILDMYGPEVRDPGSFARQCLLARRLAERDVKFIQLFYNGWDFHFTIQASTPVMARTADQPIAGLIMDLKQRGLLEDTLVVFTSEFGRTPYSQGDITSPLFGRDHHPYAFTSWMAGAGVKAGYSHGETDEFGYNIVKDPVHVHDFNATIMHLLGIDHEKLTYRFQGRDFRLTDVHGNLVPQILG